MCIKSCGGPVPAYPGGPAFVLYPQRVLHLLAALPPPPIVLFRRTKA